MSGHHPSLTDQMDSHDLDNIDPNKITRIYKIPSSRFQNEDEIVHYYGYTLGDKLGEGGFGVIYVATHTRSKIKVACKKVDLSKSKSGNYVTLAINYLRHIWETSESDVEKPDASKIEDMKNELFILKKMHNPYVVKLYAHFVANNHLFIFIRLANGGAMDSYIKEKGVIPERESQNFFAQILNGLEYMHSLNIAHRDMKPDNVLLVKHPNGRITLMITDFGLSRLIHVEPKTGQVSLSKTMCGTSDYMPPEILAKKPFNAFIGDIWSLGVTLYVMLNNVMPFNEDDDKTRLNEQLAKKWSFSKHMSESPSEHLKSIMHQMLEPDTEKRIKMNKLIEHPWIAEEYVVAKHYFTKVKEDLKKQKGCTCVCPQKSSKHPKAKSKSNSTKMVKSNKLSKENSGKHSSLGHQSMKSNKSKQTKEFKAIQIFIKTREEHRSTDIHKEHKSSHKEHKSVDAHKEHKSAEAHKEHKSVEAHKEHKSVGNKEHKSVDSHKEHKSVNAHKEHKSSDLHK